MQSIKMSNDLSKQFEVTGVSTNYSHHSIKIDNFKEFCENGLKILSFDIEDVKDIKDEESFEVNSENGKLILKNKDDDYLSVFIRLPNAWVSEKAIVDLFVAINNSVGSYNYQERFVARELSFSSPIQDNFFGWSDFVKKSTILKNENLPITNNCVYMWIYVEVSELKNLTISEPDTILELTENMNSLFENREFSDLTITVEDKVLKAHKCILSKRSSVFSALLSSDMKERQDNVIVVSDISPDAMTEVLRFIYTGKVENLENLKKELIYAAEKYDLSSLKVLCESAYQRNINTNNIVEILEIVTSFNCKKLRDTAFNFVIEQPEITKSVEFIKLTDSNPQLLRDILTVSLKKCEFTSNYCNFSKRNRSNPV